MTDIRFADGAPPPGAGVFTRAPSSLHLHVHPRSGGDDHDRTRPTSRTSSARPPGATTRPTSTSSRPASPRTPAMSLRIGRDGDTGRPVRGPRRRSARCTPTRWPRRPTSAGTTCRTCWFEKETDDEAIAVTNLTLLSIENGAIRVLSSGWYRDQLVHRDGAWLIARPLRLPRPPLLTMVNIGRIPEKWAALTPRGDADRRHHRPGAARTGRELDERVRRLANGLRGPRPDGLALQRGDRVAVLAKNSIEFQETVLRGRARGARRPAAELASRASGELARIVADGAPRAIVVAGEWARRRARARRRWSTSTHWLSYGPGGDGSYEDLLARVVGRRAGATRRSVGRRRPVLHPLHRRHDGGVEGRAAHPHAARRSGCSTRPSPSGSSRPTSTC